MVTRGWGCDHGRTANGKRDPRGDENVLKVDCGDECTARKFSKMIGTVHL